MPLSRIIQESPGYGTNLPVSFMGHQTSPTNSFFFFKKKFCFIVRFLGIFAHIDFIFHHLHYLHYLDLRIVIKVNFDDSYFT